VCRERDRRDHPGEGKKYIKEEKIHLGQETRRHVLIYEMNRTRGRGKNGDHSKTGAISLWGLEKGVGTPYTTGGKFQRKEYVTLQSSAKRESLDRGNRPKKGSLAKEGFSRDRGRVILPLGGP